VIEFSADRKRMSVVVRRESDNKVINFIKGADSVIIPSLSSASQSAADETIKHNNEFANQGLRSLMFAMKELNMNDDEITNASPEQLESDITLLGASGLRDVLQNNLANCIRDFRDAKIKVWMLTGDKMETASSVAISCGMINPETNEIHKIEAGAKDSTETQLENCRKAMCQDGGSLNSNSKVKPESVSLKGQEMTRTFVLLLDGSVLPSIFEDENHCECLAAILKGSSSVIVYRCSPDDKAKIITFVEKHDKSAFSCSVGDGANDINMIQTASIGIGIEGNEGN